MHYTTKKPGGAWEWSNKINVYLGIAPLVGTRLEHRRESDEYMLGIVGDSLVPTQAKLESESVLAYVIPLHPAGLL